MDNRSHVRAGDEPFSQIIGALTALFIPDIEDEEWAWWPASHNFFEEWTEGALAQIAFDAAAQVMADESVQAAVEQAVEIGEYGMSILEACDVEEPYLQFRLLLYSLEGEVQDEFEEVASVLTGCFGLGTLLSQEEPERRDDVIADELYGASSDWAIPLAFGLVGFKFHLLGPAFGLAMQSWYEQLLERAKAHYLHDARRGQEEL
jgi:hypothetical protein